MALQDWKKTFKFQGKFNNEGGKQYLQTYENKNIHEVLEIGHDKPPTPLKEYYFVRVRNHNWSQGKWEQLTFNTKAESLKFAKKYMQSH